MVEIKVDALTIDTISKYLENEYEDDFSDDQIVKALQEVIENADTDLSDLIRKYIS